MEARIVRVADVMRTSLHMVNGLASVQRAIEEMKRLGVSSLVIERRNDDDEYGVVTVHDIAARVISANRSTERTSVYEVMTKPALTISAEMNVKYAIRLLAGLNLRRALVTSAEGVVGLVTLRDLVLGHVASAEGD
jgi:signal-transduction protein with cAMP-binding, CBS, and nucleotidyltransferase domain